MTPFYNYLVEEMGINARVAAFAEETETGCLECFVKADDIAALNQLKVLEAMRRVGISDAHFAYSSGYGYNDTGRDALEAVFSYIFKTEKALVRPQLISGTHALTAALFGSLRPGDELLSPVGKPYDTLESVIGIRPAQGSLAEYGITYKQAELTPEGDIDYEAVARAINKNTKMAAIQRSKGYAWRKSFSVSEINKLIALIKSVNSNIICLVDNCYGEFVETYEPEADIIAGSLIKNAGGGLAPTGGYIAGKAEYVKAAASRLTAPGLCDEVGPTLGLAKALLQGLFIAPQVVGGCVKAVVLAASLFDRLGFDTLPKPFAERSDIVQAIKLNSEERVLAYCEGVQRAAPVDSFVKPVPAPMPGYGAPVVMAVGAFVQGSSIELSADAPIKPPFIVYHQGGVTWPHARAGVIFALDSMYKAGLVSINR